MLANHKFFFKKFKNKTEASAMIGFPTYAFEFPFKCFSSKNVFC